MSAPVHPESPEVSSETHGLEDAETASSRRVVITDPRAVRALAHKARVEALDELYASRGTRTATDLAARCGLSPSAMSYHLRALEKYGLVERAASEGDARERRWQAAGDQLVVRPGGGSETGTGAYVDMQVSQFRERLAQEIGYRSAHRAAEEDESEDLQDLPFMNYGSLYLDAASEREFMERVEALSKEFEARADDANRSSADGRRVYYLLSALPDRSPRQ